MENGNHKFVHRSINFNCLCFQVTVMSLNRANLEVKIDVKKETTNRSSFSPWLTPSNWRASLICVSKTAMVYTNPGARPRSIMDIGMLAGASEPKPFQRTDASDSIYQRSLLVNCLLWVTCDEMRSSMVVIGPAHCLDESRRTQLAIQAS